MKEPTICVLTLLLCKTQPLGDQCKSELRIVGKQKYYENLIKTEIMLSFFQHLMVDKYSSIARKTLELRTIPFFLRK